MPYLVYRQPFLDKTNYIQFFNYTSYFCVSLSLQHSSTLLTSDSSIILKLLLLQESTLPNHHVHLQRDRPSPNLSRARAGPRLTKHLSPHSWRANRSSLPRNLGLFILFGAGTGRSPCVGGRRLAHERGPSRGCG